MQRHIQPSASVLRQQPANQAQPSASMQPRQPLGSNPVPQAIVNLNVSSSEAVPIDNGSDEDELDYLDDEPQLLRPPHTPADNYLISSSTGIGTDSVPPTPMDVHGDGDLSVPSPSHHNPNLNGGGSRPPRRDLDVDDMIDSTVDSSGYSSVNMNQQRSICNDSNEGIISIILNNNL